MSQSLLFVKGGTALLTLSLIFVLSCSDASQESTKGHGSDKVTASGNTPLPPTPDEFQTGEQKFNNHCSRCHGAQGKGTDNGPPLVHKIYEPNHHGDFAFQRAAAQGVRAHHWQFGNMPKIDGVTPEDVNDIIQYIRWLQRQAGIY